MSSAPVRRFYKDVAIVPSATPGHFHLLLDGKPIKTPMKRDLELAGERLAEAAAEEWRGQGERIELSAIPMTRLAMSVVDHVAPRLAEVRAEALAFARSDLLCYRAEGPERLAARQRETWQPFLDWAGTELGARLATTTGLSAISQSEDALDALDAALGALDAPRLLVLHALTHRLGSLILSLAVLRGHADAATALAASRLDEIYQVEIWGRVEEAEARAARIAKEVDDFARFLSLLPF